MPRCSGRWRHGGWALAVAVIAGCDPRPIDIGPSDVPGTTDVPRVDAPVDESVDNVPRSVHNRPWDVDHAVDRKIAEDLFPETLVTPAFAD